MLPSKRQMYKFRKQQVGKDLHKDNVDVGTMWLQKGKESEDKYKNGAYLRVKDLNQFLEGL